MYPKRRRSRKRDGYDRCRHDLWFWIVLQRYARENNDIDILVLHRAVAAESVNLAIRTKALLVEFVPKVHVIMLSVPEERELNLIQKSGASILATLPTEISREGISRLAADILAI